MTERGLLLATLLCAVGALLFSVLAWQQAQVAASEARFAGDIASHSSSGTDTELSHLRQELIEAGVIEDSTVEGP